MPRGKVSTAPPPHRVWSRSPSEFYLKYAITSDQHTEVQDLAVTLRDMGIIFPPREVDYLKQLEMELEEDTPDPFLPNNLRDRASQGFLRTHGIWSMWHPDKPVSEAIQIFSRPNLREHVCTMLVSGFGNYQITRLLSHGLGFHCSEAAIEAFHHYYWKIELLTLEERERIYNDAKAGSIIQKAHIASKSLSGRASVLSHLGYQVQAPPARAVFDEIIHYAGKFLPDLERMSPDKRGRELLAYSAAALNGLRGVAESQTGSALESINDFNKQLEQDHTRIRPTRITEIGSQSFAPKGLPGRSGDIIENDVEDEEESRGYNGGTASTTGRA